jgi:thiol-disulfide isomerase/thioredoxin
MIRRLPLALAVLALAGLAGSCRRAEAPLALNQKGPEPRRIAMGQLVRLEDYLVPGKTTIFDFYSDFCPPCRAIKPLVEKLHESRYDVAVVEVDVNRAGVTGVIDWQSPVVAEFHLESIPHFKVFDPTGQLIADGDPAFQLVEQWIQAASF